VVGREVKVGDVEHTLIGVMPPGFGFPRNEQLWMPLRVDPAIEPLRGPGVYVFGRLVPGVTLERARSEIGAHIARARLDRPDVYEHLHGQVLPYAEAVRWGITGDHLAERVLIMSTNVFAGLFLMLVCGNVALLMFARAAAREGEMVVRMALGASRRRIVGQLFSEALVLATAAGLVGVAAAGYGLERFVHAVAGGEAPAFWYHASLSPRTVVYAAALTVVAAAIAGVVPALKITAAGVGARLRSATSGGGGLRFGGVWTAIIVLQVAVTVTFPVVGWAIRQDAVRMRGYEARFASEKFLSAGLRLNASSSVTASDAGQPTVLASRFEQTARALVAGLEADAAVAGVTLTQAVPGTSHPWRRIEMDEGGEAPRNELDEKGPGRQIAGGLVAPDFFDVLGVTPIRGRTFNTGDADREARTVVVNEAFVDEVLGGRNPIGRHLRYLESPDGWDAATLDGEPGPWHRIVGVVPDLVTTSGPPSGAPRARLYHAVPTGSPWAPRLLVHVNGDPTGFASRLREISAEIEPDLALLSLEPLHLARERTLAMMLGYGLVMTAVCLSACIVPTRRALGIEPTEALSAEA
jgi:hypothetical protein